MVASETGCRGRELRRGGDSFGGGDITVARRELLALEPGILWADEPLGVFARETGVFARIVGVLCCLRDLSLGGIRRFPAGELDRVDAGLAGFEAVPPFLVKIGNLEDAEACGEGDCSVRRRCCELASNGTSSLCDLA